MTPGNKWNTKHGLLLPGKWWDLIPPGRLWSNYSCWAYHHKVSKVKCNSNKARSGHWYWKLEKNSFTCSRRRQIQYFFSSVLKVHGELNSDLPAKITTDFTIETNRNLTVSSSPFLQAQSILLRCYTCWHEEYSSGKNVCFLLSLRCSHPHWWLSRHQAAKWKIDSITLMTIQIKR